MKVLIADDSAVLRERLASMISELPNVEAIAQARDASEAVEMARELRPDAAILDIRMPGGGGVVALRRIKRDRPETTVIILTNYSSPQYRSECMRAGADYFFDKSTEFERAVEILGQGL